MHFSSESIFGQLFIDIKRLLLKSLCFLHTTPFHVQFGENFPKFQKAKTYVMKTKHLPGKKSNHGSSGKNSFYATRGTRENHLLHILLHTANCKNKNLSFSRGKFFKILRLQCCRSILKQNLNDLFRPLCLHILAIWICSVWLKMLVMLSKRQSNSHWANLNCRKWSNKHSRQLA